MDQRDAVDHVQHHIIVSHQSDVEKMLKFHFVAPRGTPAELTTPHERTELSHCMIINVRSHLLRLSILRTR